MTSSDSEFSYSSGSISESENLDQVETDDIQAIIGINSPSFNQNEKKSYKYYVKFQDRSYSKCRWMDFSELSVFPRCQLSLSFFSKISDFLEPVPFIDGLYKPTSVVFDEEFLQPSRIIAIEDGQYLIQWKGLDLDQCTWEEECPQDLIIDYNTVHLTSNPATLNFNTLPRDPNRFHGIHESPIFKDGRTLKSYQISGLSWLLFCWHNKRNSILGDEMGLGKTVQAISMLCELKRIGCPGLFLVVAPLSTIPNWLNEVKNWTNMNALAYVGNRDTREIMRKYLVFSNTTKGKRNVMIDILITSFEMLTKDYRFFSQFDYSYFIIDEAHRLKNRETAAYKICSQIHAAHILLMTGTPIQNSIDELWNLLHFLDRKKFNDCESFVEKYSSLSNQDQLREVQKIIEPYILRRKKADVEHEILAKEETIIEVELTQIQRTIYRSIHDENRESVINKATRSKTSLNNLMLQLRKLCNHPYLIKGLEDICISQYRTSNKIPISEPTDSKIELESLIMSSGKMILLDKLLPKLKQDGHKVLIFSQMTQVLDIIEDFLNYRGYSFARIDGSLSLNQRSHSIEKFSTDDDTFVFLLSTRAGGFGINLTAADTVIIYDSDWNPQNDIQAQARCHRIGQTKDVKVYRLLTRGTYETEMFNRISRKLALDFLLLDAHVGTDSADNLSEKDLDLILRKGAYYIFNEECDECDKFCNENIESILEHRAHTVKDLVGGGNSQFAKVTFDGRSLEEQKNIDAIVNDNDFWSAILPRDIDWSVQKRTVKRVKNEEFASDDDESSDSTDENDSDFGPSQQAEDEDEEETINEAPKSKPVVENKSTPAFSPSALIGAIRTIVVYGIETAPIKISRFSIFSNQVIVKSIVYIIYSRLPADQKTQFNDYITSLFVNSDHNNIQECIAAISPLTPPISNGDIILKKCQQISRVYRALSFICFNKTNYHYGESMLTSASWKPSDDYTLLYCVIKNGLFRWQQFFNDKEIQNLAIGVSREWFNRRVKLLINEVNAVADFNKFVSVDHLPLLPAEFIQQNLQYNHSDVLSQKNQRFIIQLLYLFGIPQSMTPHLALEKLMKFGHFENLPLAKMALFINSILIELYKYQPALSLHFKAVATCQMDLSWIPTKVMIALADQLLIISDVRASYVQFSQTANQSALFKIEKWDGMPQWTPSHDILLFAATAIYGFSLNVKLAELLRPSVKGMKEFDSLLKLETTHLWPIESLSLLEKQLLDFEERRKRLRTILRLLSEGKDRPELIITPMQFVAGVPVQVEIPIDQKVPTKEVIQSSMLLKRKGMDNGLKVNTVIEIFQGKTVFMIKTDAFQKELETRGSDINDVFNKFREKLEMIHARNREYPKISSKISPYDFFDVKPEQLIQKRK